MITHTDVLALFTELMTKLGLSITCEVTQDNEIFLVNLTGQDARLFERAQDNQAGALVTMAKLILKQKYNQEPRIIIDFNHQRKQRLQNVAQMAKKMAEMVRVKGEEEELPPMTPAERRAVHMELKQMSGIRTESRGVEPHRRIVIVLDEEAMGE